MTTKRNEPLPADVRNQVVALVAERGEHAACAHLEVAPATLARMLASLPTTRAMKSHVLSKLAPPTVAA